jgi:hypothetical protein
MSTLLALPLLPLAVAAWLALSARSGQLAVGWVVALVAAFPVTIAMLGAGERLELPDLLVRGGSALVLDATSRAALLLFGGLWLTSGLLLTRAGQAQGPSATALLIALSGATTLALAEGGRLVYAGMLATGYGLYAILAGESGDGWRRAGRTLIVLLVISDLLVFEMLLSATAHPTVEARTSVLLMGIVALVLRGGMPPAHAWLPPALVSVGTPTAILLAAVPPGVALFGGLKLLPGGAAELGGICALLALAGGAWSTAVGLAQSQARATLGYAVAATAALLLLTLPAGAGPDAQMAWLTLALLSCCAALPLLALQPAGWLRDLFIAAALVIHGLAGGHAALHAAGALPRWGAWLAPLVVIAATLLLTVAARRTPPFSGAGAVDSTRLALTPLAGAAAGLSLAWLASPPAFDAVWMAPVGVTLGLVLHRLMPQRDRPRIPPGDLLGPLEQAIGLLLRLLRVICMRHLPRVRDRVADRLLRTWDGEAWSHRIQQLDLRLRAWPATSLMMLLVALATAFLLAT